MTIFADDELRLRVVRAEEAAHGAVVALRRYMEAADGWFKAAKDNDREAITEALNRLLEAHNGARAWAREEVDRVRSRT